MSDDKNKIGYPMVKVAWIDANSPEPIWMDTDEFLDECSIVSAVSIGALVHQDDGCIKLCQSYFPVDGTMSGGIAIPRVCVMEMVYLNEQRTTQDAPSGSN